jgi:hypothetical protein
MVFLSFFSWWYGLGWKSVIHSFRPRVTAVATLFSVPQLLKTLFAPWRRIITDPGRSFDDRMHAWADNMFSRAIGFVVRSFVLFAAAVSIVFVGIATILESILWPLLPLAVPVLLVLGIIG